jgi:hypothetical protein
MKNFYTLLLFLLATVSILAQAPEKMSYQAVLRDASNTLLTNQEVGMQISILQTTATGTAVYVETQTVTSNINGLVTLEIGTGSVVSGDFTSIDWSTESYFIKTETDPAGGTTYTITGTSQLMSVPFAMYAKTSGNAAPGPQGAQGTQGIQGATGTAGTNGTQGIQGATGTNGTNGAQGIQGETGTNGTPGIQGEPGADGATGTNGTNGTQGIQGETGFAGADGTNGEKGDNGDQGAQGIQGETGTTGTNGTNGTQGIQGATGTNGTNGTPGIQGEPGSAGADGTNGEKGDNGDQGAQGIQGETGTTGTNGTNGAQGIQGETGTTGTNGTNGTPGIQGEPGADGATGTNGTNGTQGIQGETGSAGAQGIVGGTGATGATGADGATGIKGADGTNGEKGDNGELGAQGIQGATGPAGAQGIQGAAGATGAKGEQGLKGDDGAAGVGIAQTLSFTSPNIVLSDGGGTIDLTALINDADSDISNEIQNLSQVLTEGNTAGAQLKNVTDPTDAQDAATKAYVDLLEARTAALEAKIVALETQPTYTVNTFYAALGGYVIEINADGTHGLVAAMQDQGRSNWYQANDLLSNAANHDVNGAKFKDWRIPTKRELNLMYGVYIGGNGANLNMNFYWSSTESDYNYAWNQYFDFGNQGFINKNYTASSVRAVRAF